MADTPQIIVHRRTTPERPESAGSPQQGSQGRAAVVLIHGFGGDAAATWGEFPKLLMAEQSLASWDIYSIGYSTSLTFDVAGIWSADPEIITIGDLLHTVTTVPPLDGYGALAMMAHSMGGLVLQKALVSNARLRQRVSHILLFGTPSAGLEKASPFRFWKRQVRDMGRDSPFITALRERWTAEIAETLPFSFLSIAGDRDEFVPRSSSLDPFPEALQRVVYGNHLEIVKPPDANHVGFKVAVKALTGAADAGDDQLLTIIDSGLKAIESRTFQRAIDTLWPNRAELDDQGLVALALALESAGRQPEAIELLSSISRTVGTDALGVLAGRLKRRWLVEHRAADAEKTIALYREGLQKAEAKTDARQAFYHAINCAFMELAYSGDLAAAQELARRALELCASSGSQDAWRYATEGEAHLYLGDTESALQAYGQAAALTSKPWQTTSMYQQAVRVADLRGQDQLPDRLRAVFGPPAAT